MYINIWPCLQFVVDNNCLSLSNPLTLPLNMYIQCTWHSAEQCHIPHQGVRCRRCVAIPGCQWFWRSWPGLRGNPWTHDDHWNRSVPVTMTGESLPGKVQKQSIVRRLYCAVARGVVGQSSKTCISYRFSLPAKFPAMILPHYTPLPLRWRWCHWVWWRRPRGSCRHCRPSSGPPCSGSHSVLRMTHSYLHTHAHSSWGCWVYYAVCSALVWAPGNWDGGCWVWLCSVLCTGVSTR